MDGRLNSTFERQSLYLGLYLIFSFGSFEPADGLDGFLGYCFDGPNLLPFSYYFLSTEQIL